MGAGVVPKPKHYGYGTTSRDIALAPLYRCPPDSGGQFAQFETSRVLPVFKPAPILDSDYSAIVNLDRCGHRPRLQGKMVEQQGGEQIIESAGSDIFSTQSGRTLELAFAVLSLKFSFRKQVRW